MVEDTMFSGESKNIEYNVSLPDKSEKYMKTIVAFANTQGCTKAFCSHYYKEFLFLSAVIKNVQVVRGLRKGKDQGRVVQGNIVADQSNKS